MIFTQLPTVKLCLLYQVQYSTHCLYFMSFHTPCLLTGYTSSSAYKISSYVFTQHAPKLNCLPTLRVNYKFQSSKLEIANFEFSSLND